MEHLGRGAEEQLAFDPDIGGADTQGYGPCTRSDNE